MKILILTHEQRKFLCSFLHNRRIENKIGLHKDPKNTSLELNIDMISTLLDKLTKKNLFGRIQLLQGIKYQINNDMVLTDTSTISDSIRMSYKTFINHTQVMAFARPELYQKTVESLLEHLEFDKLKIHDIDKILVSKIDGSAESIIKKTFWQRIKDKLK